MKEKSWIIIILIILAILLILIIVLFNQNANLKKQVQYNFDGDKNDFKYFCESSGGTFTYLDGPNYISCNWEGNGITKDFRGYD